jgi:hypothetical protein
MRIGPVAACARKMFFVDSHNNHAAIILGRADPGRTDIKSLASRADDAVSGGVSRVAAAPWSQLSQVTLSPEDTGSARSSGVAAWASCGGAAMSSSAVRWR